MQFLKKFSRRFYKASATGVLVALAGFFSTFSFAYAVDPVSTSTTVPEGLSQSLCKCYCASTTEGALGPSVVANYQTCSKLCVAKHYGVVGCYTADTQLPENDAKCWTQDECSHYAADNFGNPTPGTWGGQNDKCVKTKGGDETGYCYAPDIAVKLNVPVLGQTQVYGLHQYLALVYQFLLPAMSLLAVVMIMVGGLEYTVSGGNSKRLEKAKTRITNAIIGLVLLLSAYTIASLLDPRLVNLLALRTPLIKQAVLLDPKSTCETLKGYGFVITPDSGACGQQGVVKSIDTVKPEAKGSNFKVGDSCDFSKCSEGGTSCVTSTGGNVCLACTGISSNALLGNQIYASQYICDRVAKQADSADLIGTHKYACMFDDRIVTTNECVQASTGDGNSINCALLISWAASLDDPCRAYEKLTLTGAAKLASWSLASVPYYSFGQQICEQDLCDVAHVKGFAGCHFTAGTSNLSAYSLLVSGGNVVGNVTSSVVAGTYYNTCMGK